MYNIEVLEEEWKRYKRKKRIPLMIGIVLIILGIAGTVFFLQSKDGLFKTAPVPTQKTKKSDIDIYIDRGITEVAKKNKNDTLIDAPIEIAKVTEEGETGSYHSGEKKKLHIQVIDASKRKSSFKEIEKRFRMGHDIDDSLFLAKSYYQRKNYKKAEYWALQTNKVNGNVEESWLIFAKAKAKQGHRNEAIHILTVYIRRTHSIEGKVLLDKIKKGKI